LSNRDKNEVLMSSVVDSMDSGFALHEIIYDDAGNAVNSRFLKVNPAFIRIVGVGDPTGKTARDVLPNLEQGWIDTLGEIVRTGTSLSFQKYLADVGKWWQAYGFKVGKSQCACVFHDITEFMEGQKKLKVEVGELEGRVAERTSELQQLNSRLLEQIDGHEKAEAEILQYEEKLRSLASKLTLSEEHERHRIASGLHDKIIQPLIFLRIKLDSLENHELTSEQSESIKGMRETIADLVKITREFTFDLSYPILYELGLETAIDEWLSEEIGGEYGINTVFRDDGRRKPLGHDLRSFLFESVRELLVNIVKHAKAENVSVDVSSKDGIIEIIVEDDGVGFDTKERLSLVGKGSGFGLFSIRERLSYFKGSLEITSSPGNGSKVIIMAPLNIGEGDEER
jgi:signal transduction histidine kinase